MSEVPSQGTALANSASTQRATTGALTTVQQDHFYLGYIIYPEQLADPTPNNWVARPDASKTATPTTPTLLPAPDPTNPPHRRLRDPKYHPVLIHSFAEPENVATVFICNTHPERAHRYCPLANATHVPSQPHESIIAQPAGAFKDQGSYINFSHPIECTVVFTSSTLRRGAPVTVPGREPHVGLRNASVFLDAEEKKKLMRLHWRYWAGRRYDGAVVSGTTEEEEGSAAEGGYRNSRCDREADRGGDTGDDDRSGSGEGQGQSGSGRAGWTLNSMSDSEREDHWMRVVRDAIANPDVPEEEEPAELPQLHIVSQSPVGCSPEAWAEYTDMEWAQWAEKYGRRVV